MHMHHPLMKDHICMITLYIYQAWDKLNQKKMIQVVGLSASLTYAVEHRAVEQALANLCHDLSISKMISPKRDELLRSGYVPQDDSIETISKPWDVPDGVIPEDKRRSHEMHQQFTQRVENETTTKFANRILTVVKNIEAEIELMCGDKIYIRSEEKLSTWEDYAYKQKRKSVTGSVIQILYGVLEIWYVALR